MKMTFLISHVKVTSVVIHPKYIEASSSGYDIAVYKVGF